MYHNCRGWSRRYAYGWAQAPRYEDTEATSSHYESRHFGGRRRSSRSGGFGTRRPLRYLSYNLDLDEKQVRQVAAILDGLKMEREQATLDEKKTVAELASLVTRDDLSVEALRSALAPRLASAEHLQVSIAKGLHEIVGLLDADQRQEFAYLLRSGAFRI